MLKLIPSILLISTLSSHNIQKRKISCGTGQIAKEDKNKTLVCYYTDNACNLDDIKIACGREGEHGQCKVNEDKTDILCLCKPGFEKKNEGKCVDKCPDGREVGDDGFTCVDKPITEATPQIPATDNSTKQILETTKAVITEPVVILDTKTISSNGQGTKILNQGNIGQNKKGNGNASMSLNYSILLVTLVLFLNL